MRGILSIYDMDCRLFQVVNRHYDRKPLHVFFSTITYIGGATFTIILCLSIVIFFADQIRTTAIASAASLAISHIPVHIIKKCYPRKRPYLIVKESKYPINPLKDHSFPSGHTTAIFSIILPFICLMPGLASILLPIGVCVGISRIFLGLHYPSDVIVGAILGSTVGVGSYLIVSQLPIHI